MRQAARNVRALGDLLMAAAVAESGPSSHPVDDDTKTVAADLIYREASDLVKLAERVQPAA